MYILWKYDVDWASGVGGDAEQTDTHTDTHTEGVASENKIIDCVLKYTMILEKLMMKTSKQYLVTLAKLRN